MSVRIIEMAMQNVYVCIRPFLWKAHCSGLKILCFLSLEKPDSKSGSNPAIITMGKKINLLFICGRK